MPAEKRCVECGESKPLRQFYGSDESPDGFRDECRACTLRADGYRPQRRPPATISGATKRCKVCGEEKPVEEFYKATGTVDGRRGDCRDCFQRRAHARKEADANRRVAAQARATQWRKDNAERYDEYKLQYRQSDSYKQALRKNHLKQNYGLTLEQYDEMLEAQGGMCAICGDPPRDDIALHVDHDHDTGAVRGLLCFKCNAGLGQFRHQLEHLQQAIAYLGDHLDDHARERTLSRLRADKEAVHPT